MFKESIRHYIGMRKGIIDWWILLIVLLVLTIGFVMFDLIINKGFLEKFLNI